MKTKNLLKIANISGWMLLIILILYFISGYSMAHKYGMDVIMSNSQAWSWHTYLALPFLIFLLLHIVPHYVVRKQIKRLLIILSIVIALPVLSVLAIDKFQKPEVKPPVKSEQTQDKSVRCKNCPNECLIKPGEVGKCGKFKNVDGEIKPVEEIK